MPDSPCGRTDFRVDASRARRIPRAHVGHGQRGVIDDIPAVAHKEIRIHEYRYLQVPCSLVEAAINEIHVRANEAIIQPDAGADLAVLGNADQIIRQAGIKFSRSAESRRRDSMIVGMASELLDRLSRTLAPYERHEPTGCLLFAEKETSIGTPVLTLGGPSPLNQARALRKLLVLANDGLYLRCNCEHVFARSMSHLLDRQRLHSAVAVRIAGRGKWVVSVDNHDLMTDE